MEQDLARLREVRDAGDFIQVLERIIQDEFTEDYWRINLANALETSSARTPPLFAYYAALNILNAKVLFSNMPVQVMLDPATKAYKAAVERHHLFPKAYLKRSGYPSTREINQVANYALVEWKDNIDIRDEPPAAYFPAYLERYKNKPEELKTLYEWHALPEGWEGMDYPAFLAERRRLMAQVIRAGFERI